VPVLHDPKRQWKTAAYSQWPKAIPNVGKNGMGHSVRTARYRLTEWTVPGTDYSEIELYDYETDPRETKNLARDQDRAELVKELRSLLRKEPEAIPGTH